MTPGICEICGKPSFIHLTEVEALTQMKREHFYCRDHAPADIQARMPTASDEAKIEAGIVEQLIAKTDASSWTAEEKAEARKKLQQLLEEIRAGRRRLADVNEDDD